jgi:hypothetical protein
MITALQAHEAITKAAQEAQELRVHETMKIGDIAHQGDVYLMRIKSRPKDWKSKTANRQLAPGTTQGSRHCIAGEVTLFAPPAGADPLLGPVIESKDGFCLTHPEHAHHQLPAGIYQTGYQRDQAEEERRAVRD